MRGTIALATFALMGATACGTSEDLGDAATSPIAATRALARCRARQATAGDLASIEAFVQHINALPTPTTAACIVASLPRPLRVVASSGTMSAQPAFGARSPRIFILTPALTLSVVAEGAGASLIEFGEWVDGVRSYKGEIALPPMLPLTPYAAFERVRVNAGTSCGACHRAESSVPDARGAFSSVAFQPMPTDVVTLATLQAIPATVCSGNDDVTPPCVFWHALFDFGDVQQGAFDPGIDTIFR